MIKQGDSYNIKIEIKNGGLPLDMESVELVEIFLGGLIKTYPEDVQYDEESGQFLFPLEQTESHMFKPGKTVTLDIRVKFKSGDVVGIEPQRIDVIKSMSKDVL